MTKLKPCPFCGETDIGCEHLDDDRNNEWWECRCLLCMTTTGRWQTRNQAISAWNHRTKTTAEKTP